MTTQAVQSSQVQFTTHDISRSLLVLGVGVFTYEIVSKAVHKLASEKFSKIWIAALATSTIVMIAVSTMKLSRLQGQFITVCLMYVVVSIWARNPNVTIKASALPDYMVDMVAEAREGAYLSKIGYEEALKKVEVFMNTKKKSNALLVALPGIGKSTIPETIAYKIAHEQYPPRSIFHGAKLVRVDFTDLMANTMYRGSLEQRVKEMVQLAKTDRKIIFFIDEIYMLLGGGQTIGSVVDLSQLLLPVMARGDIRILGAATFQDYNRYIKPKLAFARRLPTVIMHEPNHARCFEMLQHHYDQISAQGRIKISNFAIAASILFPQNIPQKYYPDKAIDLIEYAISQAELELDDTENVFIVTERHIAEAICGGVQVLNVDALVQQFTQFIAQQPDYFPGLAHAAANG